MFVRTGAAPTATPAVAGEPIPPFVEGKVLSYSVQGGGCQPRAIVLESLEMRGGRVGNRSVIRLPFVSWFDVSPSGRYVIWAEHHAGPVSVATIVKGKLVRKRLVIGAEESRLLSWSPKGDSFLVLREREGAPREYRLADAVSGTTSVVDVRAMGVRNTSPDQIRAFWGRSGDSLVLANGANDPGADGSGEKKGVMLWEYDFGTSGNKIHVQAPRRLTLPDAGRLLGTSSMTALSLWERRLSRSFGAPSLVSVISISPSGRKALVIGDPIPQKDAPWADAVGGYEAFICEGLSVRHVRLSPMIDNRVTGFTWSRDERWLHTLTKDGWVWIRADKGSPAEEKVALRDIVRGTPLKTLGF